MARKRRHRTELVIPEDLNPTFLDTQPGLGLQFLRAAGSVPEIRQALLGVGYHARDHEEGWRLLRAASEMPFEAVPQPEMTVRDAFMEAARAYKPLAARIDAALRRLHPAQHAYVLGEKVDVPIKLAASMYIETILDRIDDLGRAPARRTSRDADRAALATLTARGVTPDMRARLRELLRQTRPVDKEPLPTSLSDIEWQQEKVDRLYALYAWLREWRKLARMAITRRDHLIRLGIAKREKPRKRGVLSAGQAPG